MMKPVAVVAALVPLLAAASAHAEGDVVIYAGGPPSVAQPIAAPGAAEMPPPPAPAPAPQNEDWNNVSHINGHPVPVGERGAYLYKFKRTDIMANPFGLFWGYYDASVSYGLSQNLAVNVSVSGWDTDNGAHTGYQLSASLPIYFRRTFSGPFLEPGLVTRSSTHHYDYAYDASGGTMTSSDTDTWAGPQLLFGWHWSFDSGLNIATAFGVAKHMTDSNTDQYASSDSKNDAVGYFRVGYAF